MPEIILYSNDCPRCRVIEAKLEEKNIEYTKSDNFDELITLGFQTAPILKIGQHYLPFIEANEWLKGQS